MIRTVSGVLLVLFCAASGKTCFVLGAVPCPSVRDGMDPSTPSLGWDCDPEVEREMPTAADLAEVCSSHHVIAGLGAAAADAVAEPRFCRPVSRGEDLFRGELGRVAWVDALLTPCC